jgi:hypothetical protein
MGPQHWLNRPKPADNQTDPTAPESTGNDFTGIGRPEARTPGRSARDHQCRPARQPRDFRRRPYFRIRMSPLLSVRASSHRPSPIVPEIEPASIAPVAVIGTSLRTFPKEVRAFSL